MVIFLKQTNSPAVYDDELAVGNTRHKFRIIRLWEQNPEPLLNNPALLPLAVLAKTDAPQTLLERVAVQIDRIEEREQKQNISACVELLASIKFNRQIIRQYLTEELMIDSPLYQEILQKGKLDILTRLLSRRFGTIPPEIQQQLISLSANQLDALSEELFDFTAVSDLAAWLQNQR